MTMRNTTYPFILLFCYFWYSSCANAVAVSSLTITDWNINIAGMAPDWDYKDTFISEITMGAYQGAATFLANGDVDFSTAILGGSILCDFGGGCSSMGIFTSPDFGNLPAGDVTNNVLSLDLSSWTMYGSNPSGGPGSYANFVDSAGSSPVNQWSTPVLTSYDPLTQYFTADWDYRDTRSFTGDPVTVYSWHLEGYVQTVPLPAPLLLIISGLFALSGFSKCLAPFRKSLR